MSWISKTISALSPNCQDAIRLQSDALDRPLSVSQRVGLRLHLLLCKWCRRYGRQLRFLRAAVQGQPDKLCQHEAQGLSPEARARLKRALQNG